MSTALLLTLFLAAFMIGCGEETKKASTTTPKTGAAQSASPKADGALKKPEEKKADTTKSAK